MKKNVNEPVVCGDVVKLMHGGPKMTVEFIGTCGVQCVWFDAQDILHRAAFKPSMLKFA